MQAIQFSAEDAWTVADLQLFLNLLDILYCRLYIIDRQVFDGEDLSRILTRPKSHVPDEHKLLIEFIEMHSPALIRIQGADKIVKQIRLLLEYFMEFPHRRRKNRLDEAEQAERIMRKCGFPEGKRQAVVQEHLNKLHGPVERLIKLMKRKGMVLSK